MQKEKTSKLSPKALFTIGLIVLALAIVIASHLLQWLWLPPSLPVMPTAPGLESYSSVGTATAHGVAAILPQTTFGSEPYAIGLYTQGNNAWPSRSVDIVYAQDGNRTFDVLEMPDANGSIVTSLLGIAGATSVIIHGIGGHLFASPYPNPTCEAATSARPLGICQIGQRLAFTQNGMSYVVTSDADHLSEGELIEITRSIPAR